MIKYIHLKEGLRMFKRSLRVRLKGFKRYGGDASDICRKIVDECWNGRYFQTSTGHFCEFYTRDFAFCAEPLIRLGYRKQVLKTLEYALAVFYRHKKITTTISPKNIPFDFPYYATDSLPLLIRSLRIAEAQKLIHHYKDFLNKEIRRHYKIVIDTQFGLVRKNRHFSSIKDYSKRKSSCYDNCMVGLLNEELKKIKILNNPFEKFDYKKIIKDNFWTGTHFIDDLSGYDFITGDANIFPFWTGIFDDKEMMKKAIKKIQENGLDNPFPLRYYHKKIKEYDMISFEIFAKDYEKDTVWTQLGPIYISLVKQIDKEKAKEYNIKYIKIIEKHKTYLEIFSPNQKPYKTFFYYSDEGMLWAAMFLDLIT